MTRCRTSGSRPANISTPVSASPGSGRRCLHGPTPPRSPDHRRDRVAGVGPYTTRTITLSMTAAPPSAIRCTDAAVGRSHAVPDHARWRSRIGTARRIRPGVDGAPHGCPSDANPDRAGDNRRRAGRTTAFDRRCATQWHLAPRTGSRRARRRHDARTPGLVDCRRRPLRGPARRRGRPAAGSRPGWPPPSTCGPRGSRPARRCGPLGGALTASTPAAALAVLRRVPGRPLAGDDPLDQQWWGDRAGRRAPGAGRLRTTPACARLHLVGPDAPHLGVEPWLRPAVADAVAALTRLTVTDQLTYGVLHGDPAPDAFRLDSTPAAPALLDWGAGGTGPLVYDVAAAVDVRRRPGRRRRAARRLPGGRPGAPRRARGGAADACCGSAGAVQAD